MQQNILEERSPPIVLADADATVAALRLRNPALDALLTQGEAPAKALRYIGLNLWREGRQAEALQMLSASAALTPDEAPIWSDLAGLLYAIGRLQEARACIERSLARHHHQPHGWLLLATLDNGLENQAGAEHAFRVAIQLDADLSDAHFGLGILYVQQRRFDVAAEHLRKTVALGVDTAAVHACLGQVLYLTGHFVTAAAAFGNALARAPGDVNLRQRYAQARLIESLIEGPYEAAVAVYVQIAGADGEALDVVTQRAFQVLSGYGLHAAAIKVGQARLAAKPDDPVQRYLLAAVEEAPLARAPDDYLVAYFDHFAAGFDKQLVDVLRYRVPEMLAARFAALGRKTFDATLDLGCGTGLAAAFLRPMTRHLTGVDLSPRMLEQAVKRALYDDLVRKEAVAYLAETEATYDLVLAGDLLVYFGDLAPLFAAVAHALKPGGLFAFNIETAASRDFAVLPSGRFAHRLSYLAALAKHSFSTLDTLETVVRLEANRPVDGALLILERTGAPISR